MARTATVKNLTCKNSSCSHYQAPVHRRFDALKGMDCSHCGSPLAQRIKLRDIIQDMKAKQDLARFGR